MYYVMSFQPRVRCHPLGKQASLFYNLVRLYSSFYAVTILILLFSVADKDLIWYCVPDHVEKQSFECLDDKARTPNEYCVQYTEYSNTIPIKVKNMPSTTATHDGII